MRRSKSPATGTEPRLAEPYRSTVTTETEIAGAIADVWAFLYDPKTSNDFREVEYAARLDFAGLGVGEIQIALARKPGTSRRILVGIQIERFEPPTFVRYSSLAASALQFFREIRLTDVGPRLTHVVTKAWIDFPAGVNLNAVTSSEEGRRATLRQELERARRHFAPDHVDSDEGTNP